MAELGSTIAISVDPSGVETGVASVKRSLSTLGKAAKDASSQAGAGLSTIGAGGEVSAKQVERSTRTISAEFKRLQVNAEIAGKSLSEAFVIKANAYNVPLASIQAQLEGLKAIEKAQKSSNAALASAAPVVDNLGMSARATNAALRNVPAQFTDIVVSLQSGQAPLTVLLQQGGQLKDMFGGVGNAAKALGGYIIGLVNPFTIVVAAAAAIAYAFYSGSKEAKAYASAIILTGNAAGTTTTQLAGMAQAIGDTTGATVGAASESLTEFAKNGNIAAAQLEKFAGLAVKLEKETGQAVSETVKQFAELGRDPVTASTKLNETTRFLTTSVYQQIKALEEQGRVAEAGALAQTAYFNTMSERIPQLTTNLGYAAQAWRGITGAAKSAWDAMLNIGRQADPLLEIQSKIAQAQRNASDARANGNNYNAALAEKEIASLQGQASALNGVAAAKGADAEAAAKRAKQTAAQIAFDKTADQFLSKQAQQQREITKATNEATAAGESQARLQVVIAGIKKKYEEKAPSRAGAVRQEGKSQLSLDVERIKIDAEALTNTYGNAEKVMEALRGAGLINERDYYASKLQFLNLNSDAQSKALEQEIARLQSEKLIGADRIKNEQKIAEARAKLAKVKTNQEVGGIVLGIQDAGLEKTRNAEIEKFIADAQKSQADRDFAAIESIRVSTLSQLEIENEGFAKRMATLALYNASRLEGEASANAAIESEKERHAERVIAIEQAQKATALSLASQSTDQMYSLLKQAGLEQTAIGKAAFLASKAMAVAQIVLNTEVAAAQALTIPYIGIGLAATIKAMGYASAGLVAGLAIAEVAGSRAGGGSVDSGKMYEVNEKGPELLSTGGKEFLMMGKQGGSITPNNKLGTGGGGAITIVNNTSAKIGKVTEQRLSNGERALIIEEAVAATAAQFNDPNSKTSRSVSRNFNMQRSR